MKSKHFWSKIRKFYKINKCTVILGCFILIFPLIVGFIYFLPIPQIIAVDSGDLLVFYGTAFGIFGSFVKYRDEINKKEKTRIKDIKPIFTVDVKKMEEKRIFEITIKNISKNQITYFDLYDEHISSSFPKENRITVAYNQPKNIINNLNVDFNITCDLEIIDKDELPKYVQIICRDIDGNLWNCCFNKVKNGNETYYYPDDFKII